MVTVTSAQAPGAPTNPTILPFGAGGTDILSLLMTPIGLGIIIGIGAVMVILAALIAKSNKKNVQLNQKIENIEKILKSKSDSKISMEGKKGSS